MSGHTSATLCQYFLDRTDLSSRTPRLPSPSRVLALVVTFGLVAASCSGDDDSLDDLAPSPDLTVEASGATSGSGASTTPERDDTSADRVAEQSDDQQDLTEGNDQSSEADDGSTGTSTTIDPDDDSSGSPTTTNDADKVGSSTVPEGTDADEGNDGDADGDALPDTGDQVVDAQSAGQWVEDASSAFAAYFVEAITGEGANFGLLEAAADYYDAESVTVDLPAFNRCNVDDILPVREYLGDDGTYTIEGRVLNVVEVSDSLWIVRYRVTQFVTGIGDSVADQTIYVGPNGTLGSKPDETGDATCEQESLTYTDSGQSSFDEALAASE